MIGKKDYEIILHYFKHSIPPSERDLKMTAKRLSREHSICAHLTKQNTNKYAHTHVSFKYANSCYKTRRLG
jgi:hypothetical protein